MSFRAGAYRFREILSLQETRKAQISSMYEFGRFPGFVDQKNLNGVNSQEEVFESTLIEYRKDLE